MGEVHVVKWHNTPVEMKNLKQPPQKYPVYTVVMTKSCYHFDLTEYKNKSLSTVPDGISIKQFLRWLPFLFPLLSCIL